MPMKSAGDVLLITQLDPPLHQQHVSDVSAVSQTVKAVSNTTVLPLVLPTAGFKTEQPPVS